MADNRALPDLVARLRLDTTDLNKAVAQVNAGGTQLAAGFEKAATGAGKLETAQTRVVGSSRVISQSHDEVTGKLKTLEGVTSKTSAAFGEFGGVGEKLSGKLQGLAGLQGLSGVGIAGVAAAAGIGAAVTIGKEAVDSFVSMAEKVLNFQRVTGASADESSRLVDVFQQVGISGDVAAAAMFRMNSRLEGTTPATAKVASRLAELGVEITKNKDGSIDLTQTLESVAEAYAKAGSQSEKDAIAFQAFGKSGKTLIPILEQGANGIKRMSDQSQLLFTQQQLEQVHAYNIEMERANQEHEKFNQAIGGAVVPILTGLTEAFNKHQEAVAYANEKTKELGLSSRSTGQEFEKYYQEGLKAADASRQDAEASKDLAASSKAAAAQIAAKRQEEDLDATAARNAADAWKSNADAQSAVVKAGQQVAAIEAESADFTTKHRIATEGLSIAQDNYNDAVAKYGKNSDQAAGAAKALDSAKLGLADTDRKNQDLADRLNAAYQAQSDAMITAAKSTVDLAAKQQEAVGPAQSNMDKTLALIDALHQEESTLAPNSPLRQNIDGYIFQLETPAVQAAQQLRDQTLIALNDLNTKEQALFATMGATTNQQVADDTEHKIQLWEEHKNKLVGQSIIPDMMGLIEGQYNRLRVNTDSIMGATVRNLVNHAANMADGIYSNIKGGLDSALHVIHDFSVKINAALGGFGVNIPLPDISPFPQGPSGVHSLAAGGVIPGYAPGHDTVPAMLSPGEGILRPEVVRTLGGTGAIEALNSIHGLGAASLANVGSLANLIGSIAGQCVVAVEAWTGHFFPVAFASQMTAWINSRIPAPGEIFVSTIPPFGHTGLVIGPNQVLDSNWGLDERVRIHALSDIPDIAGYIAGFGAPNVGGLAGLPGLGISLGEILKGLISPVVGAAHALASDLVPAGLARNITNAIIDKVAANIEGRASGGPVSPGHLYSVNESGPEFFSPDVPGQIVPAGTGSTAALLQRVEAAIRDGNRILAAINGAPGLDASSASRRYAT